MDCILLSGYELVARDTEIVTTGRTSIASTTYVCRVLSACFESKYSPVVARNRVFGPKTTLSRPVRIRKHLPKSGRSSLATHINLRTEYFSFSSDT